jgi:hypothetical protein
MKANKKKRNKKYNPEQQFGGLSREEYILLPWKPFMPEPPAEENIAEDVVE